MNGKGVGGAGFRFCASEANTSFKRGWALFKRKSTELKIQIARAHPEPLNGPVQGIGLTVKLP